MQEQTRPTHIMGVSLLHKCNFKCAHCAYIYVGDAEDHIIKPGYKLSWDQVMTAFSDCKSLKGSLWNMNYTGGEPTLWEDGDKRLIDILIESAKSGVLPSVNTNGSYFDDFDKCRDFYNKYLDNTDVQLRTFISMDNFHDNFDREKGRAKCLDSIVKYFDSISAEKKEQLPVHVITIVTKNPGSSLPAEMKEHYEKWGITIGDFPMLGLGKAKDLMDELPHPPDFKPIPEPDESEGPIVTVLVGNDYYVGPERKGKLGHLIDLYPKEIIETV